MDYFLSWDRNSTCPRLSVTVTAVETSVDLAKEHPPLTRINGQDKTHGNQITGHQASMQSRLVAIYQRLNTDDGQWRLVIAGWNLEVNTVEQGKGSVILCRLSTQGTQVWRFIHLLKKHFKRTYWYHDPGDTQTNMCIGGGGRYVKG